MKTRDHIAAADVRPGTRFPWVIVRRSAGRAGPHLPPMAWYCAYIGLPEGHPDVRESYWALVGRGIGRASFAAADWPSSATHARRDPLPDVPWIFGLDWMGATIRTPTIDEMRDDVRAVIAHLAEREGSR